MNVLGLGIDIVSTNRFNEKKYCKNKNATLCFAKRFAAKEAFVKALGIGFRDGINFSNIEIRNNKLGMPSIKISKFLKKKILKRFKSKKIQIFLSMSDEKNYAIANVIITK